MDKKVTLIYDRIENDKFVPNGWSRDWEYFPNSRTEVYCQRYNVEPIVWFQLGLDASNTYNSIIPKLTDEVDKNFIYPVEQFGGIEKLTGEEEGYEKYSFLNHIRKSTLEKIKDKKGKILILAVEESRVEVNNMVFLHEQLEKFEISPSLVIYLTGHNWFTKSKYLGWCDINHKQDRIKMINSHSQLHLKGNDLIKSVIYDEVEGKTKEMGGYYVSNNTTVSYEDIKKFKNKKRKHQFLCYNRRLRPPRYVLLAMLYYNNLIENNLVSFDLSKEDIAGSLGPNGKVHKPTVAEIVGKTKLYHKYISCQDELLKMSPNIVDFEDLTKVMGPGCENKEPYLNSYFSIVSETAFNEELIYCSSEKIYRPMLHYHPFIVQGSPYMLKNIKKLGFKTFSPWIDESYDEEEDCIIRMELLTTEIKRVCGMSVDEMHNWYYEMEDILVHNRNLIYSYGEKYNSYLETIIQDIF